MKIRTGRKTFMAFAFVFAAGLVGGCFPEFSGGGIDEPTGKIRVTVYDMQTGKPMPGVAVEASSTFPRNRVEPGRTVSDASGKAEFTYYIEPGNMHGTETLGGIPEAIIVDFTLEGYHSEALTFMWSDLQQYKGEGERKVWKNMMMKRKTKKKDD